MTNEDKLHKLVKEAYEEGMADAPPFAGAAGCGAWETSYAKDELAKLSNTAPATPDDIGAFWLVERRVEAPLDDHHPGTLLFLTGWPGKFSWTEDWQLATRFKTEAEAEDFITCDDGSTINGLEAVQHGFISQQPETPDDPRTFFPDQPLISRQSDIMGGEWCVDGTRIPIKAIDDFWAAGKTNGQIIEQYPSLNIDQVQAAVAAASAISTARANGRDIQPSPADDGRDASGETYLGMRVAAWRETKKFPEPIGKEYVFSTHWSTPAANALNLTRLFTEHDIAEKLTAMRARFDKLARAAHKARDEITLCSGSCRCPKELRQIEGWSDD